MFLYRPRNTVIGVSVQTLALHALRSHSSEVVWTSSDTLHLSIMSHLLCLQRHDCILCHHILVSGDHKPSARDLKSNIHRTRWPFIKQTKSKRAKNKNSPSRTFSGCFFMRPNKMLLLGAVEISGGKNSCVKNNTFLPSDRSAFAHLLQTLQCSCGGLEKYWRGGMIPEITAPFLSLCAKRIITHLSSHKMCLSLSNGNINFYILDRSVVMISLSLFLSWVQYVSVLTYAALYSRRPMENSIWLLLDARTFLNGERCVGEGDGGLQRCLNFVSQTPAMRE